MNKYNPSLAAAKLEVVNERIDQQMCQLFHTEVLKKFSHDSQTEEILLPSVLNNLKEQKSFVFRVSDGMGINIKSSKNANIVLTKKPDPTRNNFNYLQLAHTSTLLLNEDLKNSYLENDSQTPAVRFDKSSRGKFNDNMSHLSINRIAGRLNLSDCPPYIPLFGESASFVHHRRSLPIFKYRQEILNQLECQQVVVIAGDVGCGKTTQVPQYILENAYERKAACRIISIQPRRISVHAALDRVVAERGVTGERLVGHQTRLESKGTNNCPLIFCTTGVFLRSLIENDRCLKGITHVVIDQVHERDRFTDLLLGVFRLRLSQYPDLRLILLSADMAPHALGSYFHQEKIIRVPVLSHPVSQLFLEDILTCTKFLSKQKLLAGAGGVKADLTLGPATVFDDLITEAWYNGSDMIFLHTMKLIRDGAMPIDYQHSQTGITLLMASANHGKLDIVKMLISLGANPTLQVKGMTPYDLANEFARPEVADLLLSYSQVFSSEVGNNIIQEPSRMNNYNSTDDVLKSFYAKYSQDHANLDLIVEVLNYVQGYSQPGTILVLLPAYSEVVELRDMIIASNSSLKNKLDVHTLHGHLFPNDFKKIFFPAPADKRKVILATNIAETSISFDDVICVIDSGLFRDRENDVVFTNPKKTQWISKASAAQRVMHVRNGGIVFHLYPRSTLDGLQEYPVPEITRDSLIDVCLYARLIIPEDMRLPQFFCSLPDGPPTTAVHQAIEILESIDAFDSQSKVTDVGLRLVDLSVEPRLGKILLVGVGLRCLDPVLTIICCLARDDPFITPASPDERKVAIMRRYDLAPDYLSDHLALLKAYHLWEKGNDEGRKRQVCQENYLSVANIELIFLLRVLLVGELRASGYIRSRGNADIRNLNIHSESWTAIKAALTSGLYPNLARYSPVDGGIITQNETRSQFHFTSTLLVQEGRNNGLGFVAATSTDSLSSIHPLLQKHSSKISSTVLTSPWVIFEDQQRAGQFTILRCCSVITPITALLFAGHLGSQIQIVQLNQNDHQEILNHLEESDEDSDDIDDDEMRKLCQELHLQHITEDILGLNRVAKSNKRLSRPRKHFVILKIDEFIGFIIDSYVAQLIMNIRNKFQSILAKCIREPGRNCSVGEDAVLRSVLSLLSSEEMAMQVPQPSGVGRRPTNVSADSMLVTPELKPGDLYPIRRYMTYTTPPKGYSYESNEFNKSSDTSSITSAASKNRIKPSRLNKTTDYREVFPNPTPSMNLSFQGMSSVIPNVTPVGGRPICKSYSYSYSEGN
uniref:ATP-dependent RNA helicase YTHDC2 n=1 Tax=Daphnia galeata TaxID=27404 RepID=A0A8J2W2A0_9CRUS|nr:unnamed protein product [Daphnia galeata]